MLNKTRRNKMNKKEQKTFINELIDNVKAEILMKAYPDHWNGIELRWLIAEKFNQTVLSGYTDKRKKRFRDFENECIVNNYY